MEPRPVRKASRIPAVPMTDAPVGKSGPLTQRSRSSLVSSGVSIRATVASMTSPRLGADLGRHADGDALRPVGQQVGEAGRQDHRLLALVVVVGREVDGLRRCHAAAPWPGRSAGPRCTAWPPARPRRRCRSCPGRRSGGSARRSPARGEPWRRRRRCRCGGGTSRAPSRRCRPTCGARSGPHALLVRPQRMRRCTGLRPSCTSGSPGHDHAHRVVEEGALHLFLDLDWLYPACVWHVVLPGSRSPSCFYHLRARSMWRERAPHCPPRAPVPWPGESSRCPRSGHLWRCAG